VITIPTKEGPTLFTLNPIDTGKTV
jgi:hypothetical protein